MKRHQKAFLLIALHQRKVLWDHELLDAVAAEYGPPARYGVNNVRVALDEMASCGMIERVDRQLDDGTHLVAGKVLFRYRLTAFGLARMAATGLLP